MCAMYNGTRAAESLAARLATRQRPVIGTMSRTVEGDEQETTYDEYLNLTEPMVGNCDFRRLKDDPSIECTFDCDGKRRLREFVSKLSQKIDIVDLMRLYAALPAFIVEKCYCCNIFPVVDGYKCKYGKVTTPMAEAFLKTIMEELPPISGYPSARRATLETNLKKLDTYTR